jgi:HEPN domain-containing protein
MTDFQIKIQAELDKAKQARAKGNEGQARVCARRAAGIAAREYFARQGKTFRTPSAYDLLNELVHETGISGELRQSAEYLTLRVNEEFKLPVDVDLIEEARKLCEGLLKNIDPEGL